MTHSEVEMEILNVADAKSRFSEIISRAAAGERILVRRRTRPAAVVISPRELERLDRASEAATRLAAALGQSPELLQRIDAGEAHPIMAAFGLWKDEPELEDLAGEIHRSRKRSGSRPETSW